MRKVIGLLAVLVTATLLFFTQQTNEFMMIVYLLILYLGNSFLISNKDNNDLVPLLTCTEFFYVFDFYLFVNHKNVATIFSFLAIVFSCLTIVCLLKEKQTNLLKTTIKNEKEKSNKMNKVALVFLIIALVFNIVLISFIDYNKQIAINELTMLVMILLMTVVIFLQGFIFKDSKKDAESKKDMLVVSAMSGNINTFNINKKENKKYAGRLISNRPYFMLSIFYLLFLPSILANVNTVLRLLYIIFLIYIFIVMYYPLAKCEYYGFRENDKRYRLSWIDHFKKSFVFNFIFLVCSLTLSFSIYYAYNVNNVDVKVDKVLKHDESIRFTEEEKDQLEQQVRSDFKEVVYVGIEENNNEFTDGVAKYKQLFIYAYTNDSDDVYVYNYRKYTTTSDKYDIGQIKLESSVVSNHLKKYDLDYLNLDFS